MANQYSASTSPPTASSGWPNPGEKYLKYDESCAQVCVRDGLVPGLVSGGGSPRLRACG